MDGDDDQDGDEPGPLRTRMIDSSVVRAHRHAAGSLRDDESPQPGRSRGGLGTKIHSVVDEKVQPKALGLTPGQAADCTAAETLLAEIDAGMTVIADKAYATEAILDRLADTGATAIIRSKSNRTESRTLDRAANATRNLVERFLGKNQGVPTCRHPI